MGLFLIENWRLDKFQCFTINNNNNNNNIIIIIIIIIMMMMMMMMLLGEGCTKFMHSDMDC